MLRPAQVVAAFETEASLAADDTARSKQTEREQPENRSIENSVDREAGPDRAEGQCTISRLSDPKKVQRFRELHCRSKVRSYGDTLAVHLRHLRLNAAAWPTRLKKGHAPAADSAR